MKLVSQIKKILKYKIVFKDISSSDTIQKLKLNQHFKAGSPFWLIKPLFSLHISTLHLTALILNNTPTAFTPEVHTYFDI